MRDANGRLQLLVSIGVVAVALAGGAWYGVQRAQPIPVAVESEAAGFDEEPITVHVSGAVAAPGLVLVPVGSRVADAIAAAGGALPTADLGSLNLAAVLRESEQITIPTPGSGSGTFGGSDGIDLNLATPGDLEQLSGVGPVLAARIVEYRATNGPFEAIEDLLDVPGIGEAKLAQMRDGVSRP